MTVKAVGEDLLSDLLRHGEVAMPARQLGVEDLVHERVFACRLDPLFAQIGQVEQPCDVRSLEAVEVKCDLKRCLKIAAGIEHRALDPGEVALFGL